MNYLEKWILGSQLSMNKIHFKSSQGRSVNGTISNVMNLLIFGALSEQGLAHTYWKLKFENALLSSVE